MRIHITANKYIVNKIRKTKNDQKYTNIYKTKSIQKHYLNYFIRRLRIGERKQIWYMVQKVKEKKSELQCYINGPENIFLYLKHV